MYTTAEQIQKRVQEHYQHVLGLGYEVVGVFLQGSQNYQLDYEGSDIDTKTIVLPSLNDILLATKPVSTTIVLDNNEHIDVKDIRLMFENFKKQNINFVEILFTKYRVINPKYEALFQPVLDAKEDVAHYNNLVAVKCMHGMMLEKYKALEHPYPSIADKVEKFGYDPKQLSHLIRVYEFMRRYTVGISYEECLIPSNPKYIIKVKTHLYTLEEAREVAKTHVELGRQLYQNYLATVPIAVNHEVDKLLQTTMVNILTYHLQDIFLATIL